MLALNERKCPRCAETIKVDALACKNCGAEFDPSEVKAAKAKASRETLAGCLGCGGLVVVLALALGMCAAPETSDPVANSSAVATGSTGGANEALVAQYREILRVASPCDKALAGLRGASQRFDKTGDVSAMVAVTSAGENACATAAATINSMSPPVGLSEKAEEAMGTALRSCLRGYDRREQAFASATSALRGNGTDLSNAVDDVERSQADIVDCVAGMVGAVSEAGIDLTEVQ